MVNAEPPRSDGKVSAPHLAYEEVNVVDVNSLFRQVQQLQEENGRLNADLRDARAQIRHLELQVEGMRANAQRAAKALLEGGNP